MKQHTYGIRVDWTGNDGQGTRTYRGYRRDHSISAGAKPPIPGSSDPGFLGDPKRYNPEELLVASLSSCHMLWYLHLCSSQGIVVVNYCDSASGIMTEHPDGAGEFVRVMLRPVVTVLPGADREKALALHYQAHHMCFIARSVNFPVDIEAELVEAPGLGQE